MEFHNQIYCPVKATSKSLQCEGSQIVSVIQVGDPSLQPPLSAAAVFIVCWAAGVDTTGVTMGVIPLVTPVIYLPGSTRKLWTYLTPSSLSLLTWQVICHWNWSGQKNAQNHYWILVQCLRENKPFKLMIEIRVQLFVLINLLYYCCNSQITSNIMQQVTYIIKLSPKNT